MRYAAKAAVAALLLVGLLSGGDQPESTPTGSLPEAAVDMVTHSGSYPGRQWRVTTAEDRLIERCLRAAGFAWTGDTPPPNRHGAAEALADTRRHGYGMSEPERPPTAADESRAAQAGDPRFRTAMLGPANDLAQLTSTYDTLRREYAQRFSPSERAELTRLTRLFAQARQRTSA